MSGPLWTPSDSQLEDSNLRAFAEAANTDWDAVFADYEDLWEWSVRHPEQFWLSLRDHLITQCGLRAAHWGIPVLTPADDQPGGVPGVRWFPDARLNFAENLLHSTAGPFRDDPAVALEFRGEDRVQRDLTRAELWTQVAQLADALTALGVGPGDRVAAVLPNVPETLIVMLATAAVGGVFTSCSPDFGVQGILDRFGQVEPKVLVAVGGYHWKGRVVDIREKMDQVVAALQPAIQIAVSYEGCPAPGGGATPWDTLLRGRQEREIAFAQLPFDHPLYIMYSSGTTGRPKCIVHGAGGTLLKHMEEHHLQCDTKVGDKVFYYTTCGWMMWNWLVSALSVGASLVLYDGNPFHPSPDVLFDLSDEVGITFFGTSAKFIDALAKGHRVPRETHSLSTVRVMASTGSPLVPESFDYVYRDIKSDVQLCSISGGTDIIGCFVLGDPTSPVWRGEIQRAALGMAVEIWDEAGEPLPPGTAGELVCTVPFPSMPVFFWNDPEGVRYRSAYFERFPGVWCHGDWVEKTVRGGFIIHGRSDATLNPGGVRIGTAEIYRLVEQLDAVVESVVVGQRHEGDVRVVLFVRLRDGVELSESLKATIRSTIRQGATPRHVPAVILQVTDIPRTRSGKITELAVRKVLHGQPVTNTEALANPEALAQYTAHAAQLS